RHTRFSRDWSSDVCSSDLYATQNRQDAVKQLAVESDLVLVVGSPNSSNSNRLRELAERIGTPAYLIDGAEDLQREWFDNVTKVRSEERRVGKAGRSRGGTR